ncbi:sigma-70 family RNA polymerase sigma factor [Pseudomonas sp. S75]|uniref:sigma-70 family RNA polymerase sigma factor n=1 Tax=unclassified Pseudomonas TaxID=196821 RepID=UPI001906A166|nr:MULTISPECIES: sigma-70 family RNA polymerase sigma factor [unclassified Pseudomonas]MBJ9977266.1 sigma-70 family RNA polymerase sigma factor [Pseudomonas sp. S30]MBK0155493.1 sigma-70 family RNA polymerase sigma factor [Pseudomonas sp. S75]
MVERYYRELVGFLCTRLGSRHAAEDVAHDACVRLLERGELPPIERPRSFLYRTALNLVIDRHRRQSVRQLEPLEVLDDDERWHSPAPAQLFHIDQRLQNVHQALDELSRPCRESFLLRKIEGLSHEQIAVRLGISKAMVEKHIVNAMKHCRRRLRDLES